jgi:hypothetical protein
MDTSIDLIPYNVIGLNKDILKRLNLGIGQIFNDFYKFMDKVIDSNKIENYQENSVAQLLLDPKNGFSKQEIYDELILTTLTVSLISIYVRNSSKGILQSLIFSPNHPKYF